MRTSVFASPRRSGFTLIETVVTVGLIAVLAAFVIPTVIQKAGTADPVKVQNDLGAIQTALSTFGSDLKGLYPANLNSLTTKISTASSTSTLLDGTTAYDETQVAQWNGPYIGATIPQDGKLATGYAAFLSDNLANYDATGNSYSIAGGSYKALDGGGVVTPADAATHFVGVQITGLTIAQVKTLNKLIDGSNDGSYASSGTAPLVANMTGRLRYNQTEAADLAPTKVFYLVVPVTP